MIRQNGSPIEIEQSRNKPKEHEMAATAKSRVRPLDNAVMRIIQLAGRGAAPSRMAREIELIISEWEQELGGEIEPTRERVDGLHEMLVSGVADAEEQVSDVDRGDPAALRQAQTTLAGLTTCRDAALRWLERHG
ncbi:hypothetical protein [Roseococcus pinisoli]|uniref:KfrA N-terminal DNA-binding domain-containing protein n=1 Tax=Roseococcus pinisoli TaxID=2835040 RepID=A0ABS5QCE8_9PROT|nr:hypothetical protein [Roseococcus pinisoli]MBS7811183.1 hypothetical protein [Roseococcus pinisoli]